MCLSSSGAREHQLSLGKDARVLFCIFDPSPTGSDVKVLCGLGWMLMSSQHLSQFSDALGVAISGSRVLCGMEFAEVRNDV